jgi:acetyl esterase/lipase
MNEHLRPYAGAMSDDDTRRIDYGTHPQQYGILHASRGQSRGTVVLIHGGFWRGNPEHFAGPTPIARELASGGWTVWQIEYRAGLNDGAWPNTTDDVSAAIDRLAGIREESGTALGRVVTVGHSAGGHLAVWSLARPGAAIQVDGAVSLAGVLDLRLAERDNLGSGAAVAFIGGSSEEYPERFDVASPAEHPVVDRPVRIIHGDADFVVPLSQSASYVDAATRAGQDVLLTEVRGDHDDVIDIAHPSWAATLAAITELTR